MDDNQWEPDEEFFVKLTLIPGDDSQKVRLGRTSIMEITILNDDGRFGFLWEISFSDYPFQSPERFNLKNAVISSRKAVAMPKSL